MAKRMMIVLLGLALTCVSVQAVNYKKKSIDERIAAAAAQLDRLYFMRDFCPKLESEIDISFEKKDVREVLKQLSDIMGTPLPYTMPDGEFPVETSAVGGMKVESFLGSIAGACGLKLVYTRTRIVFTKKEEKQEEKAEPKPGA